MKRQFLCRMFSLMLAAVLVTENSMTVWASQGAVGQDQIPAEETASSEETISLETEEETADETENGTAEETAGEAESGTVEETKSETESGTAEETENETVQETEEIETEIPDEVIGETSAENTEEIETEPEVPFEMETEEEQPGGEKLAAPEIIKPVTVTEQGTVSFSWNAVENAEGYHVYRKDGAATEEEWQLCDGEMITQPEDGQPFLFTDTSAQPGSLYYYKVCAYQTAETGEAEGEFSEVVDNTVELQGITLSETEVSLKTAETVKLTVQFDPVHATRPEIVWTSSNTEVASVSEDGTVTAVGEGNAEITVKAGDKTAVCQVTVEAKAESRIILNKEQMTLRKGSVGVLAVTANTTGSEEKRWTSSNEEVATVVNGVVTAQGSGTAVITVSIGEYSAECQVTVVIPVSKVILDKQSIELEKGGKSKRVIVTVAPQEATDKTITCKSADESIVTCSVIDGEVILTSGERLGKTTVDIMVDGQTAVLTVNVVEEEVGTDDSSDIIPVRQVRFVNGDGKPLTEAERTIRLSTNVGEMNTFQVIAEILPENATRQNMIWTSSDTRVADVSDSGLITAAGRGVAQIIGKTENGVFDRITVIVESDIDEARIDGIEAILYCNADSEVFNTEDENGDTIAGKRNLDKTYKIRMREPGLTYTYRSSNEKIAVVDQTGLVTAKAPGKAHIIAVNAESGKSDAIPVTVKQLVERIEIPLSEIEVVTGQRMKLTAEVYPKEATDKSFTWKSSNTSIATFDSEHNDILLPKNPGTVIITATAKDNGRVTAQMTVHVVDLEQTAVAKKVSLKYKGKTSATIKSGTEISLDVSVKNKKNDDLDAAKKFIAYKSSNEKVAVVDANGRITAVAGGTAKITATVMDGGNASGTFTVTVEQRPEEITFPREEYLAAPGKSVTLKPTVLPAKSKVKTVKWEVKGVFDSEGSQMTETEAKALIKVDKTGKVTIAKAARADTTAVIRCTSSAFGKNETAVYKEVIVRVGKTKVTKLTMKKSSLELVGLGSEATLEYTAKGAGADTSYTWTSSNEKVIVVDGTGKVTVTGYGTAKVTLCADNAVSASCTITANPVKKGQAIAAMSGSYGIQQAANEGNGFVQLYFINKSTKSALSADLLTFTSSNPDVVYVDENGVAYANPKAEIKKDTTVTVTAVLKDDPHKRKAATKVTVWKSKQVKNIEFQYWDLNGKQVNDFNDKAEEEFKKGSTFKLKARALDADHNEMKNADLTFSLSDSSLATFKVDEKDKSGHTIIVTVNKPGRFRVTCMANDNMHKSRQAFFGIYSGVPVLKESSLGNINKQGKRVTVAGGTVPLVFSDTCFNLAGANGTQLEGSVRVESARIKNEDGSYTSIAGGRFRVLQKEEGSSEYWLTISSEELENAKKGTYEITLSLERTSMDIENNVDTASEKIKTQFKITDSKPEVKIANVTVNSFELGTWTKLKIKTKGKIENITADTPSELASCYEIREQQDGWYISIKEDKFAECKSKKIRGSFKVMLEGYENPVSVSTIITAKSTKPSLKQLNTPDILLKQGNTAQITIYNSTAKQNLTDYQVAVSVKKESDKKWDVAAGNVTDAIPVTLIATSSAKAVSYKQKVKITKEGWREPVEMNLTVKVSPQTANPSVTFKKTAFTLNTTAKDETYTVEVKTNKSNVTFKTGEWTFANPAYAELFTADFQDGKLTIGLKPEAVEQGKITGSQYKLKFSDVFNEYGYGTVNTGTLTVSIKKKSAAIGTVKFSGKLDLINRSNSTLTGTVSVSNLSAEIDTINLANDADTSFTANFYCIQNKNKFTVYARNAADLSVKTYKGKIKVTLKNGTILEKTISFKPVQSTPKVKAAATQTVYKSEENRIADYNLNACMPAGVQISEIETRVLPAGLGVEYDNGHAYVVVNDDMIKQGTYTIAADVYLKGAQRTSSSELGKPVRVKFKITVKE